MTLFYHKEDIGSNGLLNRNNDKRNKLTCINISELSREWLDFDSNCQYIAATISKMVVTLTTYQGCHNKTSVIQLP
jgi:hypothetical protein